MCWRQPTKVAVSKQEPGFQRGYLPLTPLTRSLGQMSPYGRWPCSSSCMACIGHRVAVAAPDSWSVGNKCHKCLKYFSFCTLLLLASLWINVAQVGASLFWKSTRPFTFITSGLLLALEIKFEHQQSTSIHNPPVSPLHPWDNCTQRGTSPLGCDKQRKMCSCVAFPSGLWSRPPLSPGCKPSPPTSSSTPGSSLSSCPSNTFSQSCLPSSYYRAWPSYTVQAWGKVLLYKIR